MAEINKNLNLKDYLDHLKSLQVETRDEICVKMGISLKTFYNKLNNDSFSFPEKMTITQITGITVEVLFPEKEVA